MKLFSHQNHGEKVGGRRHEYMVYPCWEAPEAQTDLFDYGLCERRFSPSLLEEAPQPSNRWPPGEAFILPGGLTMVAWSPGIEGHPWRFKHIFFRAATHSRCVYPGVSGHQIPPWPPHCPSWREVGESPSWWAWNCDCAGKLSTVEGCVERVSTLTPKVRDMERHFMHCSNSEYLKGTESALFWCVCINQLFQCVEGKCKSNKVKIIDFGFSTIVPPGKKLKVFCGTPSYMAPEIVARKEYTGFCADIWAMGVLLYALLCGSFPFRGQNDRDLYRKIVRGVFHIPDFVGEGAKGFVANCWTGDICQPLEELQHSWLRWHFLDCDPFSAERVHHLYSSRFSS